MKILDRNAIAATVAWLELVVIGLSLCPFAKAIHTKKQIRYSVSPARDTARLLADLKEELNLLFASAPELVESTLFIFPEVLADFVSYNHFLELGKLMLEELGLEGVVQIASFHPDYQFEGTDYDDVSNYTNRSPYPMLHLLREASVTKAIDSYPNSDTIYERNITTMLNMGKLKMDALMIEAKSTKLS